MSIHICRSSPLSLNYHSLYTTWHKIPLEGYTDLFKKTPYRRTFKLFPTFALINNDAVSIFARLLNHFPTIQSQKQNSVLKGDGCPMLTHLTDDK